MSMLSDRNKWTVKYNSKTSTKLEFVEQMDRITSDIILEFLMLTVICDSHKRTNSQKRQDQKYLCLITFYRKFPKYSDTQKICCKHPKSLTRWRFLKSNSSKRCRGNCKQCRPWSDCSSRSSLIWVCIVCPNLSVRKFRIITVLIKSTWQTSP